jgi:hypothetical protein
MATPPFAQRNGQTRHLRPSFAARFPPEIKGADFHHPPRILFEGHGFKMIRVDAPAIPAQMIDCQAVEYGSTVRDPRCSVRTGVPLAPTEMPGNRSVTVPITAGQPNPTAAYRVDGVLAFDLVPPERLG